jgi:DNA polymerase-3 subunit epsilon
MRTLYLDTETTGLHPPDDAIVEIAIVDDDGDPLLDTLVNPLRPIGYASTIHGISDAMVAHAPTMDLVAPQVARLVAGARLVIYNAPFDVKFFADRLAGAARIECAMQRFAHVIAGGRRGARWRKLADAAAYVGHDWDGAAHRALADARAARSVWRWLDAQARPAAA